MAVLKNTKKDWQYRCSLGDQGVDIVLEYLRSKGITAQLVRGTFKSLDIVSEKDGKLTTFEVKTYANAEKYNCHWVEVFRHTVDGWANYGLATSNADYWAFVSQTKIIFIEINKLRNALLVHGKKERETGVVDKRGKIVYKPTIEMLEGWGKCVPNERGLQCG